MKNNDKEHSTDPSAQSEFDTEFAPFMPKKQDQLNKGRNIEWREPGTWQLASCKCDSQSPSSSIHVGDTPSLLQRAIAFVREQQKVDIPEGWDTIIGLVCGLFYEQEQKNEAIQFAEWIAYNRYAMQEDGRWFGNTTEELYDEFKEEAK